MRREFFVPLLGQLFKAMGRVPIGRRHRGNTVEQVVARFRAKDDFTVAITPEGSRKVRDRWKTGFYHIAEKAGVPIRLAVISYRRKKLGIFEQFIPTGDLNRDIHYIRSRYRADQAKKLEPSSE